MERPALQAKLEAGLTTMPIKLDTATIEKLLDYLILLQKWNKVHNLTAVRDPMEMVTLHLLDSLAVLPYIQGHSLLDVGSGAGLPGIVLAICKPDLQVTTIDAVQKKVSFMRQVKVELGLKNLEVAGGRVESYKPKLGDAPKLFDRIISRAFSEIALFISLTRHLIAAEGYWLAMKGVIPDAELAALPVAPEKIEKLNVPDLQANRHLIFIKAY